MEAKGSEAASPINRLANISENEREIVQTSARTSENKSEREDRNILVGCYLSNAAVNGNSGDGGEHEPACRQTPKHKRLYTTFTWSLSTQQTRAHAHTHAHTQRFARPAGDHYLYTLHITSNNYI